MISEQDLITIDCQFCNQNYIFGAADLDEIFGAREGPLH
jgi:redox-regulated HSP33 family molecular chaperone